MAHVYLSGLKVDDAVPSRPRRREPKWTLEVRDLFLCHRGAEPSVIAEIIATLREKNQFVTIQDGDGLSVPLADLRARVRREIDGGCRHVIVLLNEHLTGPIYRQTFATVRKAAGTDVAFWLMRVEACDLDGVDTLSVDLANLDDPEARRREILKLCPTERDLVRYAGAGAAPCSGTICGLEPVRRQRVDSKLLGGRVRGNEEETIGRARSCGAASRGERGKAARSRAPADAIRDVGRHRQSC